MKIHVNTEIIQNLEPCQDRLDSWLVNYKGFDGDICKFLDLKYITHTDKLWVVLRLIPLEMRVVFALDMSFSAAAAYVAVTEASYAAAYAANAANAAYVAVTQASYAGAAAANAANAANAAAYAAYAANAANAAAANAANAAAYAALAALAAAANAANAADARIKEQDSQIEVLKYLIRGEK